MTFSHVPLLAFFGVVLAVRESQGLGFDHKDLHTCLEVQTKRVDLKILQSYTIKNIPIHAVLFSTKDGIKICVDPSQAWARKAITVLDKRGQNPSPGEERSRGEKDGKKKTIKKTRKTTGKKTQRKMAKKTKPSKKASAVKSIMTVITTRTPAGNP